MASGGSAEQTLPVCIEVPLPPPQAPAARADVITSVPIPIRLAIDSVLRDIGFLPSLVIELCSEFVLKSHGAPETIDGVELRRRLRRQHAGHRSDHIGAAIR